MFASPPLAAGDYDATKQRRGPTMEAAAGHTLISINAQRSQTGYLKNNLNAGAVLKTACKQSEIRREESTGRLQRISVEQVLENSVNDRAFRWIHRMPLRWAGFGVLLATILSVSHAASIYFGLLPGPKDMSVTGFVVVMWLLLVAIFATTGAALGAWARTYLLRFKHADDATAKAKVWALPYVYAAASVIMLSVGLAGAYLKTAGTTEEFPLSPSVAIGVLIAALVIAWLVGFASRRALYRRLSPEAASASASPVANAAAACADETGPPSFATVWYSTNKRVNSVSKLYAYEDRGTLAIADKTVHFKGRKQTLTIRDITDIGLVGQRASWTGPILIIIVGMPLAFLVRNIEGTETFVSLLALLLFSAIFTYSVNAGLKWVRIAYRDADEAAHEAYFADGSDYGWGGIRGGTRHLCGVLERLVTSAGNLPQYRKPADHRSEHTVDEQRAGAMTVN